MAGKDVKTPDQVLEDEIIYEEEIKPAKPQSSVTLDDFFQKYKNIVFGVGGVIVVAIVGFYFYKNNLKKKNVEAQEVIVQAVRYFEMDSLNLAINGDGVNQGLESIVDEYGATETGNLARFYLGLAHLQTGGAEKAIEYLEDYKTNNSMASTIATSALASAYEETGDFATAAKLFEESSASPERNTKTTPFFLNHAARNYELAGKTDKALSLYKEIKKKYPTSEEGQKADLYIAKYSEVDENF